MLMKHKKNESINKSKDEYYKYSNFMDMISPIASEASRNKNVQKLFEGHNSGTCLYRDKNILNIPYVHEVYIIILN